MIAPAFQVIPDDIGQLVRDIAAMLYLQGPFRADSCPRCEEKALLVFRRNGKRLVSACGSCPFWQAHAASERECEEYLKSANCHDGVGWAQA